MKYRSLLVCVLLAAPAIAPGANREMQELQRDVGLLQQQIKDLQRTQDEKLNTAIELAKQSLDAANKANGSVAAITQDIQRTLGPLKDSLAAPLAAANATARDTSNDVRALQQAVSELSGNLARIQSQMDDMKRLVQTLQTPVTPPQQAGPGGNAGIGPGAPAPTPSDSKPSASAVDTYQSALGDFRSQKYDLSLQGFTDFLRWYPADRLAPNAQFYIGMIRYNGKNYEQAVKDFDDVLEHYTQNFKTEEAMLYKARSLVQVQGRRSEGAAEYKQLIKEYPKSEHSKTACDELKNLGMNCTLAGSTPSRTTASKRK
jgi:tol-pal system protein YbgF